MKAVIHLGRYDIEVEAATQKDLFKAIASTIEVFGEKKCGLCGCEDVVPFWRTVTTVKGKKTETYEYPEFACTNPKCRAKLCFGTHNDDSGTLFPQRKLNEKGQQPTAEEREQGKLKHGPHRGWFRWVPPDKSDREGDDDPAFQTRR